MEFDVYQKLYTVVEWNEQRQLGHDLAVVAVVELFIFSRNKNKIYCERISGVFSILLICVCVCVCLYVCVVGVRCLHSKNS